MAEGAPKGTDEDGAPNGARSDVPGTVATERTGPIAALIIFLALLFGAVPTAAAPGTGDPLSRVSPARAGRQAPARGAFEQDRTSIAATEAEAGASVPPPAPAVVTEALSVRPASEAVRPVAAILPRLGAAAYRARAPPAA
ncbi:MAG TPA: hypothetical protein VF552_03755 [Allosphingosinicella sp.]|jgi:hypothetical protein